MNFDELPGNPRKTTNVRQLGTVDVAALKEAVLGLPQSFWDAQNAQKPNRFDSLDKTQHIIFRFISNMFDWRESRDSPLLQQWRPLLEPILSAATADYGYQRGAFPRIMLARMAPGGVIKSHQDSNPSAKWPHKIHVPILTNPDVIFYVHGVGHNFKEGEAVEVDNLGVHAVENRGATDRIHLIFEYYDLDQPQPDWIDPLRAEIAEELKRRAQPSQAASNL